MDIEHLSKAQIILLTLLVSFVTSIATGIVTVSLMEQAPPAIAQTVNRVVERTVEKVVPAATQAATAIVTTEKTVVVKESDLIAKAVAKVTPSVVRLYKQENAGDGTPKDVFIGLGTVISESGSIVAESAAVESAGGAVVVLSDGTRVWASLTSKDADSGLMFLQGATSTETVSVPWKPLALDAGTPVLGESVFAIAGKSAARISDGLVTALPGEGGSAVDTSINADSLVSGSPLITIDGTLLGISSAASRAVSRSAFVSASVLMTPAPEDTPETEKKPSF